ncbi:MAG: biopolymer transporter ExbD, partial [Planctomycetales bacterium]|nr:biopolymer transporter ExbD [Planctomycetales bacterium]
MRVPTQLRSGDFGFNMTPMIDVVFLLIIFFLVSSHLAKQEAQMQLPLPVADSGEEAAEDTLPRVTVNVMSDGGLMVSGRRVEANELLARLQQRLAEVGQDLEVRIRGDRQVDYQHV